MTSMIIEATEKFKKMLEEFFDSGNTNIDHAEIYLGQEISGIVLDVLSAYYEREDANLLADKQYRKTAGLRVERRHERRQVLTLLGNLEYQRTYYRKSDHTYCHPIDELVGVAANQKVSNGVSLGLVEAAISMSYAKSSKAVTGGQVSRQTVLHKVRASRPREMLSVRRSIPVLHIDADEDHVHLQSGKSGIVPLVSVYEGVKHVGNRGICQNIVHYGEYGKKAEELWEEVLTDLERRYDLESTKIYLHGDGAAWIREGLNWLPNSVFVLDRYHKNKALKNLVSGIDRSSGCQYEYLVREAVNKGDRAALLRIRATLLQRWPQREKTITRAMDYLENNLDAIAITGTDKEAIRGGATEPHVSHVLSSRLSSRPMGWSPATLSRLVPLLAAGADRVALECEFLENSSRHTGLTLKTTEKMRKSFSLGLPHPDRLGVVPAASGKVTPLYTALRSFLG